MSFDVTDLTGMPTGPVPKHDLVSSWSLDSMQTYLEAHARIKANAMVQEAVHCHYTGHGQKEHHQSREGAVLAYLIAAENSAVDGERGWYAARVDAYADLHGIRDPAGDLAHTHGVEECLRQFQQVLVVTEDEAGIQVLAGLKREYIFESSDEELQQQDHKHCYAHQVQQSGIASDEHMVHYILHV